MYVFTIHEKLDYSFVFEVLFHSFVALIAIMPCKRAIIVATLLYCLFFKFF